MITSRLPCSKLYVGFKSAAHMYYKSREHQIDSSFILSLDILQLTRNFAVEGHYLLIADVNNSVIATIKLETPPDVDPVPIPRMSFQFISMIFSLDRPCLVISV